MTKTTTNIQTIVTHNGDHHADDTFAVAVLKALFPEATVSRTRIPEIIKSGDIAVDVGGGEYDHHQIGGNGVRSNGVPYASFGLVWKNYGLSYVTLLGGDQETVELVDKELVQGVDALDNGYKHRENALNSLINGFEKILEEVFSSYEIRDDLDLEALQHLKSTFEKECNEVKIAGISSAISAFNCTWDDVESDNDLAFLEAVEWAGKYLKKLVKKVISKQKAKSLVLDAFEKRKNPQILVLDRFVPWGDHLSKIPGNEEVLYVIFPDTSSGEQRIQTVPVSPGSFTARKDLPESWAGLRGSELNDVVGINDGVFCHNGRFIAGAVSFESILKMAELALKA